MNRSTTARKSCHLAFKSSFTSLSLGVLDVSSRKNVKRVLPPYVDPSEAMRRLPVCGILLAELNGHLPGLAMQRAGQEAVRILAEALEKHS